MNSELETPYSRYTTRIQYNAPALPGGDLGMFPAAHPRPILDAEYDTWLDFLSENQVIDDDLLYFEPYVWEVERSEDAPHFWQALGQLEDAITRYQKGE